MPRQFFFQRTRLSYRLLFWILSPLLGIATIISIIVSLSLTSGPINLDFAVPYLERYFSSESSQLSLKIKHAELLWDSEKSCLTIHTRDVHVENNGSEYKSLKLPHFEFRYHLASLFLLRLMPGEISVHDAVLDLYQDNDGNLKLDNSPTSFDGISFVSLNKLELKNLKINVRHASQDRCWQLPKTDVDITRHGDELHCTGQMQYMDATVKAEVHYLEDNSLKLIGVLSNFDFDHLGKFWHKAMTPVPRAWVLNNLSKANVSKANIDAEWDLQDDKFEMKKINGQIQFTGMTVRYFDEMPVVSGVNGTAFYDDKKFDIKVTSGMLNDIKVNSGLIHISDMDKPDQNIDIDLQVSGPLNSAIEVLKKEPLDIRKKLGVTLKEINGSAKANLHFDFPLETYITLKDINFRTVASLSNVVAFGLEKGTYALNVDQEKLDLSGKAEYKNIPINCQWIQKFDDEIKDWKVKYQASAVLSADQLEQHGLKQYTDQPITIDAILYEGANKQQTLQANVLFNTLKFATYESDKQCRAGFKAKLTDGKLNQISDVFLTGPNLEFKPEIEIDQNARVKSIKSSSVKIGSDHFSLHVNRIKNGIYILGLEAIQIDLGKWIAEFKNQADLDIQIPVQFKINLKQGLYGNKSIQNINATGLIDQNGIHNLDASGSFVNHKNIISGTFHIDQKTKGKQKSLEVISNNAGELLHLMGISQSIHEGEMHLLLNKAEQASWQGKLKIKHFNVRNAPITTQILSLSSPFGIIDAVSGTPLVFEKFSTKLSFSDTKLYLKNGRGVGSALGFKVNGSYDTKTEQIKLNGTILPYNALNIFFAKIPVVSTLIGGKSGGLFGINYSLSGSASNPAVFVNPLSVLTPGILREIFATNETND